MICISFFLSLFLDWRWMWTMNISRKLFKFSWSRILCVRNWWNWPDQFNFTIIPSRKRNHYNKITIPPLQKMVCAKLGWILLSISVFSSLNKKCFRNIYTFEHVTWKSIGIIYSLRSTPAPSLVLIKWRCQKILSWQYIGLRRVVWPWPLNMWPENQ